MSAQIYIDPEPYALFWELTAQANTEVGGFGYITEREIDGYLYPVVDHIFLINQEVTASKIDFDDDQLAAAIEQAVTDDRLADLRFCIHSHCDHDVFWSGTDDELIENIGETGAPYLFSVVVNKKRKTLGRLDIYKHDVPGVGTIQEQCSVSPTPIPGLADTAAELLETHCSPPSLKTTKHSSSLTKSVVAEDEIYYYGTLDEWTDKGETETEAIARITADESLEVDSDGKVWYDSSKDTLYGAQAWASHLPGIGF